MIELDDHDKRLWKIELYGNKKKNCKKTRRTLEEKVDDKETEQ